MLQISNLGFEFVDPFGKLGNNRLDEVTSGLRFGGSSRRSDFGLLLIKQQSQIQTINERSDLQPVNGYNYFTNPFSFPWIALPELHEK